MSALYLFYLIKSALGINISHRYGAPDLIKLPLKAFLYLNQLTFN
jgi:hypothetical protein